MNFEDRERSYFGGINCLPTGHSLIVKDGKLVVRSYYDPRKAPDIRYRQESDYIEAARELFERAVDQSLRAPERPAIVMSSGFDSCAVACVALEKFVSDPLISFTAVPEPGWGNRVLGHGYVGDERAGVEAMARAFPRLEAHFLDCVGDDAIMRLPDYFVAGEIVPRNVMNVGWTTAIANATRAHGKRLRLTGDNGNATFSYQTEPGFARLLASGHYHSALRLALRKMRRAVKPTRAVTARELSAADPRWESFELDEPARPQSHLKVIAQAMFGGNRDEAGGLRHALTSLTGVQIRDPFGSRALAEFCMGIRPEQFEQGGLSRSLIKQVMRARLPNAIITGPRARQAADTHLRLTRRRRHLQNEIARSWSDPILRDIIDFDRLLALLDTWPEATPLSTKNHPDYLMVHLGLPRALANIRFARWVGGEIS